MDQMLIRWATPAPVDEKARRALKDDLDEIRTNPRTNRLIPFASLPMLHFASITLFDEGPHQNDPVLVFESNIDGRTIDYVRALVRSCRGGLDAIYGGCRGYPAGRTAQELVVWLMHLRRVVQLHHEGHPHLTLEAIEGDYELRRSIASVLAREPNLRQLAPAKIVDELRARLHGAPRWFTKVVHPRVPPQASDPVPLNAFQWVRDKKSWLRAHFILVFAFLGWLMGFSLPWVLAVFGISRPYALGVVFVLAFALMYQASVHAKTLKAVFIAAAVTFVVWLSFQYLPANPAPPWWIPSVAALLLVPGVFLLGSSLKVGTTLPLTRTFDRLSAPERDRLRTLVEAEDQPENGPYNHVAGLSVLKCHHRRLRWLRTYLTLRVLNLFYRSLYIRGRLLSIPSIHFAQWSLVDDRRLLFVTNYDGQADSYLDDFFTALATGVAFIWIDTEEFPGTIDPRHLKIWVRRGQRLATVRYRAPIYNGLTVGAINSNAEIRMRLLSGRRNSTARRWLSRFGVAIEEPTRTAQVWARLKSLTNEQA